MNSTFGSAWIEGVLNLIYFFFFNDTATTEIYTLSLHDALPISSGSKDLDLRIAGSHCFALPCAAEALPVQDRKSTRLNSSHSQISYAVFCLKKKKNTRDGDGASEYFNQALDTACADAGIKQPLA